MQMALESLSRAGLTSVHSILFAEAAAVLPNHTHTYLPRRPAYLVAMPKRFACIPFVEEPTEWGFLFPALRRLFLLAAESLW